MWKFMIFGVAVQIVLLISLMDVNVSERDAMTCHNHPIAARRSMLSTIFIIEDLRLEELKKAVVDQQQLGGNFKGPRIYNVINSEESQLVHANPSNSSIFDGKRTLYVGRPTDLDNFDTRYWCTIDLMVTQNNYTDILVSSVMDVPSQNWTGFLQEKNHTKNDSTEFAEIMTFELLSFFEPNNSSTNVSYYSENEIIPVHLATSYENLTTPILNSAPPNIQLIFERFTSLFDGANVYEYPIKIVPLYSKNVDDVISKQQIVQTSVASIYDYMESMSNEIRDKSMFILSSSMDVFTQNVSLGVPHNATLAVWCKNCDLYYNATLDYSGAYGLMKNLLNTGSQMSADNLIFNPTFVNEGNLLTTFNMASFEFRIGLNQVFMQLSSVEALNAMIISLNFLNTEYVPATVTATLLIFVGWLSLLSIKSVKLLVPRIYQHNIGNTSLSRLLDVTSFSCVAGAGIFCYYSSSPFRYFIYYLLAILLFRLCLEELFVSLSIEASSMDRLKILFQICLTLCVVECLFWATSYYTTLYILFIALVSIRIFQGAFSATNIRTTVAFAASALFVGVFNLCPAMPVSEVVTLNVTVVVWLCGGLFAMKFLMDKSSIDRFVMVLCIIEYSMASVCANFFVMYKARSVIAALSFFTLLSGIIPLLGSSNLKCRLLELSMTTASVYIFFATQGEGLVLFALFTTCFCSYLMDNPLVKKEDENTYFSIFPILFYSVTIVMACELLAPPLEKFSIFQSQEMVAMGLPDDLLVVTVVYTIKLAFLLTLLTSTSLSSYSKFLELPSLFLIIVVINLVSLRTFFHTTLIPERLQIIGNTGLLMKHIITQVLAILLFFLYPYIQVLCHGSFFECHRRRTADQLEPMK